ncbi:serine/threonine-protein kinase LMTK1 isoform X1 [Pimephales promelas]|uniref:serine/threonine-protein kinase LMTK1 isoform X1 n=1 Tax=Pimephales promelas TaxID=90988 RepID=UPI0019555841|nr:serine/threonine-protein kinase LMTK1 isoform X1 [Pimephales promelas]KAG1967107.1 serine/threonine-protein kinase LMTK1 [Pimephales promelas]
MSMSEGLWGSHMSFGQHLLLNFKDYLVVFGGSPLSELSWPSSLAVVAVSFSGLFMFVFLMLACLCCKKRDISFKEFENTEGEEGQANLSTLASPSSQNDPEVYILPLTEVSLPVSKQPGKSFQLLKSTDLGRHSLLYIKEMGHGWFGKVLLGEVNAGLSTTQVVVKELKASASVQEQMQFLEEVQPYRVLQHPALLQCLSQCSEVTPYLLVMEHCPLGDVKGYLRSCRATDSVTPDPLILQRMACEIASGLLYLHKHNYIHSDLALRNCLLTSELAVKIGDYGLSHSKYKDDYYVTADQIWVPLRWIAPELIDEVHGNLLVVDQTKDSNVWSLGVTIWELFELGNQPYRHYSDRQVLTYAVKEQQLKLPKPLLKVPLCERWYEVMQFCWLQPEQRPVVEEVHLLLSYLCAKGTTEAEEDFEQRWNSLRPSLGSNSSHRTPVPEVASSTSSSFPLLEHFSMADSFQSENGDDILTVTETSHGLNFEYKWEQAQAEQPYCSSSASGPLGKNNPHYQDVYYPHSKSTGSCKGESLPLGVSPSYYESDHPGVVPVLSAHSPSVSSEYYIRIEEPVECNINLEDTNLDYSPRVEASNSSLSSMDRRSPIESLPNTYWSAAKESISNDYDSDSSLNMEPLQRRVSNSVETDQSETHFSSNDRHNLQCEQSPQAGPDVHLIREYGQQQRGSGSLCHRLEAVQESPLGISVSLSSPSLAYCDPYLESNQRTAESTANEAYYDMMGPVQKNVPRPHYMSIDIDAGDGLLLGMGSANPEEDDDDDDLFSQNMLTNWNSNHSANNNSLSDRTQGVGFRDAYLDLRHPTPSSHVGNFKSRELETSNSCTYNYADSLKVHSYLEATDSTPTTSNPHTDAEGGEYLHLCPEGTQDVESSSKCHSVTESQHIYTRQKNIAHKHIKNNTSELHVGGYSRMNPSTLPTDIVVTKDKMLLETRISPAQKIKLGTDGSAGVFVKMDLSKSVSECNLLTDSRMVPNNSSISLVEINDCTDIPSGVITDYPLDYAEVGNIELTHRALQRETGSRHCEDTINLASSSSPCEAFSPDSYHTPIQPKSLDSGYDTENNESPEFILKDLEGNPALSTSVESDECDMVLQMDLDDDVDVMLLHPPSSHPPLISLGERNQYRDSAYFSDYDTENDKSPSVGGSNFFNCQDEEDVFRLEAEKTVGKEGHCMESERGSNISVPKDNNSALHTKQLCLKTNPNLCSSPTLVPMISMLSPFPPEMGGCLTKESTPDDGIGLESDHSGEEPNSECHSSTVSEGSSTTQEASGVEEPSNRDFSSAESLGADCVIVDFSGEIIQAEDQEACNKVDNTELPREGHNEEKEDEDSVEGGGQAFSTPKRDDSLENILPVLPEDLDVPAPLGNGDEADEEDSEDSDESDELRSYNIQEQSDESDDEFPVVPVIVSDRSSARHLRSLLKMPSILTQSFCDELESKKKAVSFFDDVTVFLFDQESPTGELGDYSFPVDAEPNGQASEVELPQPHDRVTAPEDSLGRNFPEESGECEWQDDFPLMPSPSTSEPGSEEITTPPNSPIKSPDEKPVPPFSRFRVSRFSITQVSDSDTDSMGGNSENGAQE